MEAQKLQDAVAKHSAIDYKNKKALTDALKADEAGYTKEEVAEIAAAILAGKEEGPAALPRFDICNVDAVRKAGEPKVIALKINSIEKTLSLSDAQVAEINSFTVNAFGTRAYPAGKYKAGDEVKL